MIGWKISDKKLSLIQGGVQVDRRGSRDSEDPCQGHDRGEEECAHLHDGEPTPLATYRDYDPISGQQVELVQGPPLRDGALQCLTIPDPIFASFDPDLIELCPRARPTGGHQHIGQEVLRGDRVEAGLSHTLEDRKPDHRPGMHYRIPDEPADLVAEVPLDLGPEHPSQRDIAYQRQAERYPLWSRDHAEIIREILLALYAEGNLIANLEISLDEAGPDQGDLALGERLEIRRGRIRSSGSIVCLDEFAQLGTRHQEAQPRALAPDLSPTTRGRDQESNHYP